MLYKTVIVGLVTTGQVQIWGYFNLQHAAGFLQGAHRLHHLPHHQVFLACAD